MVCPKVVGVVFNWLANKPKMEFSQSQNKVLIGMMFVTPFYEHVSRRIGDAGIHITHLVTYTLTKIPETHKCLMVPMQLCKQSKTYINCNW